MALNLSVVINTRNSALDLPDAIKSVKNIAKEIVVCDMESTDGTPEMAKKLGAQVIRHKMVGYVEPARNFAIEKASSEWVLILDSDERLTKHLETLISSKIKENSADFYRISRKNIIFGKWVKHSRWWPDYNIRLFRKGHVIWNEVIHSVPMTTGKGEDFPAADGSALIHNNYRNIDEYLERMIRYSGVQSQALISSGYKFEWKDLITKPSNEFFSRYFFGEGYKDGVHGLSLCLLQAFSEFVVYLKVWQTEKFPDKEVGIKEVNSVISKNIKDLVYWQNDSLYKETGSVISYLKKKLR